MGRPSRDVHRLLVEAREQQAATAEILRVISDSPADAQPVLEAVVRNAARLCDASDAEVFQVEGRALRHAAKFGPTPLFPIGEGRPINRDWVTGRAVVDRQTVHVRDLSRAGAEFPQGAAHAKQYGHRTTLATPLLRQGVPIGAILVRRTKVRSFTRSQIALLQTFADQAVIAIENVRLFTELEGRNRDLTESLEQQTATGEILGVISSSPTDVQPVFDAIAERAVRLCDGLFSGVFRFDGERMHIAAGHNWTPNARQGLERMYPMPPSRQQISSRAVLTRAVVHVPDLLEDPEYPRDLARAGGWRSALSVPMLRDGDPIGAINVIRAEAAPFSDRQIELLKTFADQAVIAIENVRLFTELRAKNEALTEAHARVSEALERETATSEVLKVISRSTFDLQPVLETLIENATRLCGADRGQVYKADGDVLRYAIAYGLAPDVKEYLAPRPLPISPSSMAGRAALERRTVHVPDVLAEPWFHVPDDRQKVLGLRTVLAVPMLRGDTLVGVFTIWKTRVEPFTDRQIELVTTFADQAVIAIENVRLFTELEGRNRDLTEALEQQTATGEILRVISRSPTDVQPVFNTIIESAVRLCDGVLGTVFHREGELIHVDAYHNLSPTGIEEVLRAFPMPARRDHATGRAILDGVVVHIPDLGADQEFATSARLGQSIGYQSVLVVPLLRDGQAIGSIFVGRPHAGPFSESQIALLRTFADQAVIAIENVRLFQELQTRNRDLTETLEQQTATGEILRVISSSPTDVQPVFDSIARSAARLCEGRFCFVFRFIDERLHFVGHHGLTPEGIEALRTAWPMAPSRGSAAGRAVLSGAIEHIPDVHADPGYELGRVAEIATYRSTVAVPMVRDSLPIGAITVSRTEAGPFSDRQIDLLKTFADQAVIAIENVRLFTELESKNQDLTETLEQQTATADILRVISSSPTDVQPVFDMIAASAARLCGAQYCFVYRFEEQLLHFVAHHGLTAEVLEINRRAYPAPPGRSSVAARSVLERSVVQIPDVDADPDYALGGMAKAAGYRSAAAVPILREGLPIGSIAVTRAQAGLLPDRQIELLKTFAAQAVIAVENVRLFTELENRNRDLSESLEQQTATGAILQVMSASPTDIQPTLDAVAESAMRLCDAKDTSIALIEGDVLRVVASHGQLARWWPDEGTPIDRGSVIGRAVVDRRTIHVRDLAAESDEEFPLGKAYQRRGGHRTNLAVPLLREGVAIGVIAMRRGEVLPFTDRQVTLLQTFADQAVIAIENVRLFKELEARNRDLTETLEQQTATGEILRVISSSPTDVQPVFDTIVRSAVRLCDGLFGAVNMFDGEMVQRTVATHNYTPAALLTVERMYPMRPSRQQLTGRAILGRAPAHLPDVLDDPDYAPDVALAGGWRGALCVPMLREGNPIGTILVTRAQAGPFSDRQIELLETFARQAVIAIDNVRLFRELEARTAQLTRSVEELKALGEVSQAVGSTLDLETVLETIVSRAVQLSGSDSGTVYEFDEAARVFHARATHRVTPEHLAALRASPIRLGEGAVGRAGVIREPVAVTDMEDEEQAVAPQVRWLLTREGFRSLLAVPLVREERLLGGLVILRRERGAFSPEVVALLQTFAAQSVLAIHNAGLFREIRRQQQYSEALVETSPVAIVTIDLHGKVVGWNPGAERLFGYTATEALGRLVEDLVATPELREEVRAGFRQTFGGERLRAVTRRARKDGTFVDVEISAMPVVVAGVEVGVIAIYHDITELLRARREAEAANEAKSAFLATMSHEIRTPMNAVIGMSGLLLNTALSDEQREYAEVVRQSGDALLTVINDILDFSKIEAGKLELESQPFDLRECVETALDLVAARAAEKGLDLAYVVGDGTPAAIVGDVTRLRQVLLNLLSNAVKFTERGEVVLSVSAHRPDGAALHELVFSVRDTGIGIPPDRLGRLFQSFSQVDASTTRRYGGTGLGLAISQRLTELMGGRIEVESEVGAGSEFRVTIRANAAEAPVPARRDLSGAQPSLRDKRVLVVDDNATNRRIVTSHLEAWGMASRATGSPAEALAWIRGGEPFDAGILDMHMPEMDGVALARAIREHLPSAALPLILFTSLGRREARADEEGFAAYLHKPIKPSQLFDALVSVLAERPVHVAPRGTPARTEFDPDLARRHPLRILLAEDNAVNQKVALRLLGQMGYRADVAANGLEAIEAVERQAYDVVLMDVQMPELDGFEASREINRRWPGERRPRLVAMTANAMQGDRELCEAAGMDDYVSKPIRVEELVAALERCRWRAEAGARAAPAAPVVPPARGASLQGAPSAPGAAGPGSPAPAPAIDRTAFDQLVATMDRAFAAELIDTFVEDGRELIATLQRALADGNLDDFRRAAHSLKSSSETLGAAPLAGLARELETRARAGSLDGAAERIEPLAAEYARVVDALGALRRGLTA
jgi:PAS domain S-box-containing protein